ncbi:hypothetical protein FA15DRAFT_662938 [Coprinopsis marcescibilis]|uniref:Uncharacterized protein n=1 Tax=Coprinopsis marcescibilis TaxID=230819 RepID=A0A5C3LDZ9_COPMA|nr:hypothetical protein FA15DRAFT_662938 [Coprinopsis marcescibilis]
MENTNGLPTANGHEGQDVFADAIPVSLSPTSGSGTRIHFPSPLDGPSRPPRQYPDYLQKSYGMNFSPPVRRSSPLNPMNPQKTNQRRNTQSSGSPMDSPTLRHRRIPSPGIPESGPSVGDGEVESSFFANEYDLYPRILLDVQRAIKLKARREARLKRQQSPALESQEGSPVAKGPEDSPPPSKSPWSSASLGIGSTSATPPRKTSNSTSSDIDFSPSTTTSGLLQIPVYAHPVPTSLDNGRTLDWTGSAMEDDRKWHMSIGKRKEKDRILPLGVMAEQQELMYKDKLSKIQAMASAQTQRKASITKQQLGRRYKLVQNASGDDPNGFNFLKVAHWYSTVNPLVKRSLEKAEPFSWLRHLEGPSRNKSRSEWHMTALIMEEYLQAKDAVPVPVSPPIHGSNSSSSTIPDNDAKNETGAATDILSPTSETPSFGPHQSPRIRSLETKIRGSLDSTSSFRFPNPSASAVSAFRSKASGQPYLQSSAKSDASSVADSASDFSDSGPGKHPTLASSLRRSDRPARESESAIVVSHDSHAQGEPTAVPMQYKASTSSGRSSEPQPQQSQSHPQKRTPLPRRIWNSNQSLEQPRRFLEDDELRLRKEYEAKTRLLEESNKQNHRIRQLLNRISAAVREYESIQNTSSKKPGVPHHSLPKDLTDAFSHDPAAVTGSTRRLRGWRAVEDIHQRIARQREVFHEFLAESPEKPGTSESVLSGSIEHLLEALGALEDHKLNISALTSEVSESLLRVQGLHNQVKNEYNQTVSKTSVVYPELSHIVALEESYRDRYQGFYDFGMDALTLLLDTVTPFWRNYGKTIGEDVRDFLIIPLYRNEFTGEAKRYPIRSLPRRTLRHWLGLVVFFFASIVGTLLQIRGAIASLHHYLLHWIPYDSIRWTALPLFWIAIVIQWIAVIIELAIVLMQIGTMAWWLGWLVRIFR